MIGHKMHQIRRRLDELDGEMVRVLAERFKLVDALAAVKDAEPIRLKDPVRESELLERVTTLGTEAGLSGAFVQRVFREVLDHSVRRQLHYLNGRDNPQPVPDTCTTVAYQGIEGAYSHLATMRHFETAESAANPVGCTSFRGVVDAVCDGTAAFGVLPIENTTAGSINEVYDLLAASNLSIVGEEIQEVDHCLLGLPGATLDGIRRVRSHPQALAQCSRFLNELPECRVETFADTAMAARDVAENGDLTHAAVASEAAASAYGLQIIQRHITNQNANCTRFVVVAREPRATRPTIPCKTSILFAVRHEVGSLAECLNVLASAELSLTKIESRPRPHAPWEYVFYLDFEGNTMDPAVRGALERLAAKTVYIKILGSYPTLLTRPDADARPLHRH